MKSSDCIVVADEVPSAVDEEGEVEEYGAEAEEEEEEGKEEDPAIDPAIEPEQTETGGKRKHAHQVVTQPEPTKRKKTDTPAGSKGTEELQVDEEEPEKQPNKNKAQPKKTAAKTAAKKKEIEGEGNGNTSEPGTGKPKKQPATKAADEAEPKAKAKAAGTRTKKTVEEPNEKPAAPKKKPRNKNDEQDPPEEAGGEQTKQKKPKGKAKAAPEDPGQKKLHDLSAVKVTKRPPPNKSNSEAVATPAHSDAPSNPPAAASEAIMRRDTIEQLNEAAATLDKGKARRDYKAKKQRFYNSFKSTLSGIVCSRVPDLHSGPRTPEAIRSHYEKNRGSLLANLSEP